MSKNLLVVESGGKIDNLKQILGPNWIVKASGGHIRDMPRTSIGVNKDTLAIEYEVSDKGDRIIRELSGILPTVDRVVLATDDDREGEAIADHLRTCLNLKVGSYERCTFKAITKDLVISGLENTREINEELVIAQTFRRIIDRLVGFESTQALQIKTGIWSVVGRVQTPTLWLIVDRDREIESFVSQTHYGMKLKTKDEWSCLLNTKASGLEDENGYWLDKALAQSVASKLKTLKVVKSDRTKSETKPPNAFKTTTMQQAGINKLGVSGKEVMELASILYNEGLITYIRTDDESMSDEGYDSICDYVTKERPDLTLFGSKRSPAGKKSANAQEAHECIRPADFSLDKIVASGQITAQHVALYKLVYERALASQLDNAIIEGIKLTLEGEHDGKKYTFDASNSETTYKGWRLLTEKDDSQEDEDAEDGDNSGKVPLLDKGKVVAIDSGSLVTKKTSPPPSYTEVRLIAEMEKRGIGRPSTYQSIIGKLDAKGHGYVKTATKNKRAILVSTPLGRQLIDNIDDSLGKGVLNIKYTQEMEDNLDKVAHGCEDPNEIMFNFIQQLDKENEQLTKNPTHPCGMPDCKGSMVRGKSKKTKKFYWRCILKDCTNIVNDDGGKPGVSFQEKKAIKIKEYSKEDGTPMYPCPKCKSAIIGIDGKYGMFWPCSKENDPECDYSTKDDGGKPMSAQKVAELTAVRDKATAEAVELSTTNDGKTALWDCTLCKSMVLKRKSKAGKWWFKCSSKACGARYWPDDKDEPKLAEPMTD